MRALGLGEGLELDDHGRCALEIALERGKAYDTAVRLLAARGRSSQEIVTRLRHKGLGKDSVAHAVGRLEAEGLLDDANFARDYVRSRTDRGYGWTRILAELSRKGVDRLVAEQAVAEAGGGDEGEVRERLLALARKRAAQLKGLDRDVARRRLVGYLARRGYGAGELWQIVAEVVE
ncbi:MAG TPA: regulatory protein RecX [Gemmatimonadales bacterium]|nr:regulatory protein RecX [Gemmatimonadales bacterium]